MILEKYSKTIENILEENIVFLRNKHHEFMKIGNRRYFLSKQAPLIYGEMIPSKDKNDGAKLIKTGNKFSYMWVLNTDRDTITCWRVSDGDEKTHGKSNLHPVEIRNLEKEGTLNRVTNDEFHKVEKFMNGKYEDTVKSLRQSVENSKKDDEKNLDKIIDKRVNDFVEPEFKKSLDGLRKGVTPIGFKPFGGAVFGTKMWIRQAASHVLYKLWQKYMNADDVRDYAKKSGIDTYKIDLQDFHFAIDDGYYKVSERLLPKR